MSYTNKTPLPNDAKSLSQDELLNNFAAISTLIQVNHVNFDDVSGDQGKHKFCQLPVRGTNNTPRTITKECGLYSALGAFSFFPELVVAKENNTNSYAISEITFYPSDARFSWSRLPSGLLLKWGLLSLPSIPFGTGGEEFTVKFKDERYNIPTFETVINIQLTQCSQSSGFVDMGSAVFVNVEHFNTISFNVLVLNTNTFTGQTEPFTLFYLAIGT